MKAERLLKQAMNWKLPGKKRRGRPRAGISILAALCKQTFGGLSSQITFSDD